MALAALLLFTLASTAFAAHLALTLGSASNAALGENVVISSQGRTLYTLTPETSKHLLCKSQECLGNWPPLTVKSAKTKLKDGSGVQGRLGLLRRGKGVWQVTLRGVPLYRYSRDHAKGEANGEGVESFGGTWHAVTAASGESPSKASTPSTPAPAAPAAPGYAESTPMTTPSTPSTAPSTPSTTTSTMTTPTPPPYQYPTY